MIAHYDIEQRSKEWHSIRYRKVGGTLCKGLFVPSDTLLTDLLSCMLEPLKINHDDYVNADMQRGIDFEPYARREMSAYIGKNLFECGWINSTDIPIIGISPDGITACETEQAEIKCPNKKKHTEILMAGNVILDDYKHQCVHAFAVNEKLVKLHFGSYRPESEIPLKVITLERHTLVAMGTAAKPIVKPVSEWVKIIHEQAKKLTEKLMEEHIKLQGI